MFPLDVSEILFLYFLTLRDMPSDKDEEEIYANLSKMSQTAKSCSDFFYHNEIISVYLEGRHFLFIIRGSDLLTGY